MEKYENAAVSAFEELRKAHRARCTEMAVLHDLRQEHLQVKSLAEKRLKEANLVLHGCSCPSAAFNKALSAVNRRAKELDDLNNSYDEKKKDRLTASRDVIQAPKKLREDLLIKLDAWNYPDEFGELIGHLRRSRQEAEPVKDSIDDTKKEVQSEDLDIKTSTRKSNSSCTKTIHVKPSPPSTGLLQSSTSRKRKDATATTKTIKKHQPDSDRPQKVRNIQPSPPGDS